MPPKKKLSLYRELADRRCAIAEVDRAALASLQPVTQAPTDVSIPGLGMSTSGERVDSANVTQAKSEALPSDEEIWSNDLVMAANASAGLPMLVLGLLVRNSLRAFAAPQEAVERQPLTDAEIDRVLGITAGRNCSLEMTLRSVFRAAEGAHGIGPATQEKQHG